MWAMGDGIVSGGGEVPLMDDGSLRCWMCLHIEHVPKVMELSGEVPKRGDKGIGPLLQITSVFTLYGYFTYLTKSDTGYGLVGVLTFAN
jgi:hypothetical protein